MSARVKAVLDAAKKTVEAPVKVVLLIVAHELTPAVEALDAVTADNHRDDHCAAVDEGDTAHSEFDGINEQIANLTRALDNAHRERLETRSAFDKADAAYHELAARLATVIEREKTLVDALEWCVGTIEHSLDTMREAEGADDDDEFSETSEVEEQLEEIRKLLPPKPACTCFHAPEQHRPDGCEMLGCECKYDGAKPIDRDRRKCECGHIASDHADHGCTFMGQHGSGYETCGCTEFREKPEHVDTLETIVAALVDEGWDEERVRTAITVDVAQRRSPERFADYFAATRSTSDRLYDRLVKWFAEYTREKR